MKTDNGPPFNGSIFAKHAQELGFRHRKITPGRAEANGDVERFMQTVKKKTRESLRLKGKHLNKKFKERVATIVPHPIL